jgi:toxin ParE1/3/4
LKRRAVAFAPEARRDLLDLDDWIAERAGINIAESYIERLEGYCMGFGIAGERGQRRDDIRAGLRIIGFEKRITIAFTISETEVTILPLYYGGQNWTAEANSGQQRR